ncbi:MAG: TetR family transcriptional regulator [Gordonia sp. (in: high G+C Gram-positive bacteria)]
MDDPAHDDPAHDAAADVAARRAAIADAAIELMARGGMRGLTHSAVDRELGEEDGATSFYARTRRQLVHLVIRRLAERTLADLEQVESVVPRDAEHAVALLVGTIDAIGHRSSDVRARHALAVELVDDPELHSFVTYASPAQPLLVAQATRLLAAAGVADPGRHAVSLVALTDSLLFHRLSGAGVDPDNRADTLAVVRAYVSGLPKATTAAPREPREPGE